VAEGGPVVIGAHCIIMEHAVLRGTPRHPTSLGNHVLVGPHTYLTGCTVEDNVFIATGATIFNGARLGARAEVRINGLVHLNTSLPADAVVPIGWVAIFGLERAPAGETIMPELTRRYGRALARHKEDEILYEG
jgi:carbonic anhydrase/acetyltransferase-like protein (isoleucine patch superfamily)